MLKEKNQAILMNERYLQLNRKNFRIRAGLRGSHVAWFVALDETVAAFVALFSGTAQDAAVTHVA